MKMPIIAAAVAAYAALITAWICSVLTTVRLPSAALFNPLF
ncbi:hypothetical protein [Janthinobacterium agaricidamnosum]|uniref:Putative membrane protein n=1 Tax=Janthinobacterium agaricidamnosum NBRC 102515 = DSM 9628 TaxID=1349767 RepID=W0UX67_9BURK|nr:hypothetical protein [Janthinobacterium agaricidamnosum]CDG81129.1 putative membrane protein [Janthinobacterium agaricidamnosum NBRC 102515 = DSM 9628]